MGVFQLLGLEEKLQLSGVEPGSAAVRAMVDFNLVVLDHDHEIFTGRAFHTGKPPKALAQV
jgi:hypothetical protein